LRHPLRPGLELAGVACMSEVGGKNALEERAVTFDYGSIELGLKLANLTLGAGVWVLFRSSRANGGRCNSRRQDQDEAPHDRLPFSYSANRRRASWDVECFTMLMRMGSGRSLTGMRLFIRV